jgi:acyl phosphate:glycerol-3-phosphate acyltransferase
MFTPFVFWLACYLLGAVPFGYLLGRAQGVDLFTVGSKNIGATNAFRELGWKIGSLVFVLDFLKGAGPVALASLIPAESVGGANIVRVGAASCAFLGHLFPIYLRFRGGKGVATGAGVVAVLVPVAFAIAIIAWGFTLLISRMVSVASMVAAVALCIVRLLTVSKPFSAANLPITIFCLVGALVVILKHRANIQRLRMNTEKRTGDGSMRQGLLRTLHIAAVGIWVGAAGFFNFVTAPSLFTTFEQVVATSPSDRTANVPIVPAELPAAQRKQLASALAGAGVGPVFPKYFALQLVASILVAGTAYTWRREPARRHSLRWLLSLAAFASVVVGWWISSVVSELRLARFNVSPEIAKAAVDQFAVWHLVSLGLSVVTIGIAFTLLILAAFLPHDAHSTPSATSATSH